MAPPRRALLVLALCLAAAAGAKALRPTARLADTRPPIDLETLFPREFAGWRVEPHLLAQVVNPQQQALLNKIYNQTLARTYVNAQGQRVMLSVAYGGDQSDSMQVHKPEACYPAQGFMLLGSQWARVDTAFGPLAVRRVDTRLGSRREPVTYWTTVGETVVAGGLDKKINEMRYSLTGRVPDGMLVRISSIEPDAAAAYVLHDGFIRGLLAATPQNARGRVAGLAAH